MATIEVLKAHSSGVSDMISNEYWNRIFLGTFLDRECFTCGIKCEQWWVEPAILEAGSQSVCPVVISVYYQREIDPWVRWVGWITSISWGLISVVVSLYAEKMLNNILRNVIPLREQR